jgi:hypothetical protein
MNQADEEHRQHNEKQKKCWRILRIETTQTFTNLLLLIVTACGVVVAHESQRPYIRVLSQHASYVGDKVITATLEFEDIGVSPAWQTQYSIDWNVDSYPMTKRFDYRRPNSAKTELMPHSPVNTGVTIDLRGDAADVEANKKSAYVWGEVTYCSYFCLWPLIERQRFCYAMGGADLNIAGDCTGVIPREQPRQEPKAQPVAAPPERGPTGPPS